MALNNMGLGFVFTARNLASGTIGRLRGQLGGLGNSGRLAGLAMRGGFAIAAAGIVPLVAGLGTLSAAMSLAQGAAEFEQRMAAVGNTARASAEDLQLLHDAAIQAGIATQFSPIQAAEGLQTLASQGFNATESIRLLDDALEFAAGGGISVEQAARSTAAAIRAFNLQGDEMTSVADRLTVAFQTSSLQAGEMALAIGTVSRGAGVAGQNMNEMLIAMGLVRNTGVEASTAASSVSSALLQMANNSEQLGRDLQVRVTDEATGAFRPLLDIIGDVDGRLSQEFPDAAERAAAASDLFGRFGLTAFSGISTQLNRMIQETDGIDTMSQAIAAMRAEMEGAENAAENAADALLDTFGGQLQLLEGTMQTFGIVLGEPFAAIFKPIVKSVVEGLNVLLQMFNNLPDGMKTTIAGMVVAAGAFMSVTGVVTILTGLIIVLLPFLKLIAIAIGVGLLALAPFIAGVAAAIAAVIAFRALFEANIGGIGDFMAAQWDRIKLVFQGVVQLFSDGGFSGEVREEMNRAENGGIRQFVVNLFRIGSRIMEFFRGVQRGFSAALVRLGPSIDRFMEAMTGLGEAFGFVDEGAGELADTPMDSFAETGIRLGNVLVDVLGFIVESITTVARFWTGLVNGFRASMAFFAPVFAGLRTAFTELGESLAELFGTFDDDADTSGDTAQDFATIIGAVFGTIGAFIADGLTLAVRAITFLVDAFLLLKSAGRSLGFFMVRLGIRIGATFQNVVDTIRNAIDTVIAFVGRIVSRLPAAVRPDFANDLIQEGARAQGRQIARGTIATVRNANVDSQLGAIDRLQESEQAAQAQRGQARESGIDKVARLMESERSARSAAGVAQPIQLNVQIDGETVARATAGADRSAAAQAFTPGVPAETA